MTDVQTLARRERREYLLKFYAPSFKDHQLTVQAEGPSGGAWLYTCRSPLTSFYSFNVVVAPQVILVYGDIGELLLRVTPGGFPHEMLRWLRDSTRDPIELDYLLGKCPNPEWEFGEGELRRYLKTEAVESLTADQLRGLREWCTDHVHDHEPITQTTWAEAWYRVTGGDSEAPDCNDWSAQMLCQYLALYHFVRLLPTEVFHEG